MGVTTKPHPVDVTTAIARGMYEEQDLQAIADAVRERQLRNRAEKAALMKAQLSAGDIVRLVNIRPTYLNGQEAVVTRVLSLGQRVELRLVQPTARFSGTVKCPASCLEFVRRGEVTAHA